MEFAFPSQSSQAVPFSLNSGFSNSHLNGLLKYAGSIADFLIQSYKGFHILPTNQFQRPRNSVVRFIAATLLLLSTVFCGPYFSCCWESWEGRSFFWLTVGGCSPSWQNRMPARECGNIYSPEAECDKCWWWAHFSVLIQGSRNGATSIMMGLPTSVSPI